MNADDLKQSLSSAHPPDGASEYIKALWHDANNNWEKAHTLIQDINDANGSWIHAYLHRKEGDIFNADYWYRKAGKARPAVSLDKEWEEIVTDLSKHSGE